MWYGARSASATRSRVIWGQGGGISEAKAGARITRAVQTIEPALADGVAAGHLRIEPGVAVLRVFRTYLTSLDRPVQAQIMRCHPVHYRYTVTLFGGGEDTEPSTGGATDAHYVRRPS